MSLLNMIIAENRRVKYDYHIIKSFEAGIVLKGTEVKSVRARHSSIKMAYCYEKNNEIFIKDYHIALYNNGIAHDVLRIKKLLLKKREIKEIKGLSAKKHYTLVPVSVYSKGKYIKLHIALVIGKNKRDKREEIKKRDYERSLRQDIFI